MTSNVMEAPSYLELEAQRLSIKESQNIVDNVLYHLGIKLPNDNKAHQEVIIGDNEKIKFYELVNLTRKTGVCWPLQKFIDREDPIFTRTFGMSSPNHELPMSVDYAGYSKSLEGPFRAFPVEMEISRDIEFYREETCYESDEVDFEMCFRNYRGFLLSCVSMVDAYINSHILMYKHLGHQSDDFEELKQCFNTERRIELFCRVFAKCDITAVNGTEEWDSFIKIKGIRNEMVHATVPFLGVSIKTLATNLNYSKKGIGGLLRLFQKIQGRPSLGFIEEIRNAPDVYYNKISKKGDGSYTIKKIFNK